MNNDNKILSHTTWNCKYHIVFAPKYRRKIFYKSHRREIMEMLRELCRLKGVEIVFCPHCGFPCGDEHAAPITRTYYTPTRLQ